MDLFSGKKNILLPKSISATLVAVLILNSLFFALIFYPQKAEALPGDPGDIANAIFQPLKYSLETSGYALEKSKYSLDLAYQAKETEKGLWERFKSNNGVIAEIVSSLLLVMMHQVLAKITNDIVAWINGGGKGKLRVLQDPGKFLTDALDEAGGVLAGAILNVDPNTLCDASYLKFKLRAAFTGPYAVPKFDEKVACTFTGAAAGLQKFQEDFTNGGWASFIELARKENNQIGQTLITAEEMAKIKSEKSAESVAKLNISKGFLAQEKCTVTKAPAGLEAWGIEGKEVGEAIKIYNGTMQSATIDNAQTVINKYKYTGSAHGNTNPTTVADVLTGDYGVVAGSAVSDEKEFIGVVRAGGGEVVCKTVTPAEQISELANTALQAPIKRLEGAITGLTEKLGTGAGSVIKPYVLAIAGAGLNLLLQKEIGLITNAITPSKKPRKARRQTTSSLQENTMLAQSAGALAGSVNDFRSFLLKAMLEFNIYVANATTALTSMDVLGRIPINRAETEIRGGTWYLGGPGCGPLAVSCGSCPSEYQPDYDPNNPIALTTAAGAPYSCAAYAADATTTNTPGKVFFEEARWCGAYYQEIAIPIENPEIKTVPPLAGHDPLSVSLLSSSCPTLTHATGSVSGDCTDQNWVRYNLDGDADFEMATRIVGYDDTSRDSPTSDVDVADRFIRQNIVGTDTDNNGIPDAVIGALDPANITFSETLIYTVGDTNHNAFVDAVGTSTASELRGLFEMRPEYANTIIDASGTTVASLPQGLSQAAVAGGYIFGGHNQFGHSSAIRNLSDGSFVAALPLAVSGSVAVLSSSNNRVYLFGGFDSSQSYNTIWEFNPANNTVRTMSARLPAPASGVAAAYYPATGRIYLFGGTAKKGPQSWVLEYNPTTDSLVTKNTSLLSPLAHAAAALAAKNPPNGQQRIFVFGGFGNSGFSSNGIFEYDPTKPDDGFSPLARKSANIESRGFLSAATAPTTPNIITLIGGQSEYGLLAKVEQYNAQTDSVSSSLLPTPRSKGGGGVRSGAAVSAGGISFATAGTENAKLFPQGDIYHIPATVHSETITTPFWEKYFSPKFDAGSAMLLNTRTEFAYGDFTGTIGNTAITTQTNADARLTWLAPPFYPELLEKAQELMEKSRIIEGYNYPASGVKNYQAGLADQLGATPDDDPYDNNPSNPRFFDRDVNANGVIEEQLGDWEGYKGSVTDTLNKYNNLTQIYQILFGGLTDENALEGVDKDLTILSPAETNIKLALIGSRCPALPPSATSTPDLAEKCPRFGSEYNMARRFIFEADDTGANPTGITTGFATNPFTGEKSSALAGLLNLDEMTTQLQSLSPDRNIIKLIRLRQLLEQLQVAPIPIQIPGKADASITPQPLSGVDLIVVSLPGYEHIQAYLNDATTKNLNIQTLIEAYGYTNAKDAYPEISKHLDEIFDDILSQITDDLKETFLKRIEEQLEESKIIAQHRLRKFLEYVEDLNATVKLEVPKQRGDQLAGLPGVDVVQIGADSSILRIDAKQMFINNGQGVNVLLSRSPLRLTDDERNGIIGSAIYKIKSFARFMGTDVTTAEFSTRMAQYYAPGGDTPAEREADLDQRVKNVLKDVYMYHAGIYDQTDETLTASQRALASAHCKRDAAQGYYCDLTTVGPSRPPAPVRIFKDARTKLAELQNDFSLMVEEMSRVTGEFRTLFTDTSTQKQDLDELVKLLNNLYTDYDQANKCVGLPTDAKNLWLPSSAQMASFDTAIGSSFSGIITVSTVSGVAAGATTGAYIGSFFGPLGTAVGALVGAVLGAIGGWLFGSSKKKKAREEAERRRAELQRQLDACRTGITNYNKHLGQIADQFICNKINPKYE